MPVLSILISTAACTMPSWACDAQARTGLDARLVYAVCLVESSGNTRAFRKHDGHSPSYGACQMKLSTARLVGFKGDARELMDPSINYYLAARYLRKQLLRYGRLDRALSAYNAGTATPANVHYVSKVLNKYKFLGEQ